MKARKTFINVPWIGVTKQCLSACSLMRLTGGRCDMGPTELLAELSRRGVELAVEGERLRFRPQEAITLELRAALVEHKSVLLRLLENEAHEVRWRMDAMRSQVPRTGAIPTLLARPEAKFSPRGTCRH